MSSESRPLSQPKKETVVAWFREQTADRQAISDNFARHLATFVRLPESQRGGNRKWRVAEEDNGPDHAPSRRVTPPPGWPTLGGTVPPIALARVTPSKV